MEGKDKNTAEWYSSNTAKEQHIRMLILVTSASVIELQTALNEKEEKRKVLDKIAAVTVNVLALAAAFSLNSFELIYGVFNNIAEDIRNMSALDKAIYLQYYLMQLMEKGSDELDEIHIHNFFENLQMLCDDLDISKQEWSQSAAENIRF